VNVCGADVFPCESVAVQLTVVVPIANVAPDGVEQDGATEPSTTSFAAAAYVTTAPAGDVASTVIDSGTVTVGAVVSVTTTTKLALLVFACASVAVQSTVVEPTAKVEPEGVEQDGVTDPSTRSVADAAKSVAAPAGDVASTVIGPGTVSAGGVVSVTTTVKDAVPTFPFESTAMQSIGVEPTGKDDPGSGVHDCDRTASSGSVAPNV
jgi:hypothetical protein